jgi:hypothetical protein
MSTRPGYELGFSFPPGWTQLPVLEGRKVLERDKDLEAWSAENARAMLGPGAPAGQVRQRAAELTRLTIGSRARHALYGLAFYPAGASGLVAILDAKRVVPDRKKYPELTLDALAEVYAARTPQTAGDIDVSQASLPSGPAVRVRSRQVEDPDANGQGILTEGVTHAILPPGMDDSVVVTMTWTALQLGDKLAAMADAIANTIRITPA